MYASTELSEASPAHGIALSREQHDYARQRIADEGLQQLVSVELRAYRDVTVEALYDKVSSIGMFEHVGLANRPIYLVSCRPCCAWAA